MSRVAVVVGFVFVACTGGPGPIDTIGGGSSNGGSSGGGSSSGIGGGSSSGSGTSGGTSGGEIRASEFSQACVEDTDCVAVYEGSICNQCGCPNAAIAKSAATDYLTKRQNAGCPETDVACANDCVSSRAVCTSGTCTVTTSDTTVLDGG
jgi:hypothetical protein